MDKSARKFIIGSNGHPDYLLIAEKTNIQLGLKVVVEDAIMAMGSQKDRKTLVGLRIRSAPAAGTGEQNLKVFVPQKALVDAWPKIQFGKIDDTRASTFIGGIPSTTITTGEDLKKFVTEFEIASTLAGFVCECVPAEELQYSKSELTEYITEAFAEIAGNRPSATASAPASNVVDLQAAALAKLKDKTIH